MKVWLVCFVVLFALAQLFDWVKGLQLPLPIYILGGAFLAVASNYDKLFGTYLADVTDASMEASVEQAQLDSQVEATGSMISPATED
ncbi:MAG: hypothetical protein NHB32_13125 [Fischerella sp. CENA71]|nr:hypothetical protein [Fischerella sp. CENA71]